MEIEKKNLKISKKKQIVFTIVIWLIFFVLMEGASRLLFIVMSGSEESVEEGFSDVLFGNEKWWIHDPYLFWRLKPDDPDEGINSFGFRGPEISVKKPGNTRRVLMIGDSSTYGVCVTYKDTYAYQLEVMLNKNSKRLKKWQVINAGVPGYSSLQGCRYLDRLARFQPDIIVAYFGANDLSGPGETDVPDIKRPILFDGKWDSVLLTIDKSYFYQVLKGIIFYIIKESFKSSANINEEESVDRVGPADFEINLKEMVEIAKGLKSEIFFMPYIQWLDNDNRLNSFNNDLNYHVEDGCVIELEDTFLAHKHKLHMFFCDDVHPTRQGHQLIAEEIFKSFQKAGIL